jgi:inter-alpha-trypsin inhibitor heavy chain H2
MDGYFVHFFAPEDVPPLPKHIIFVLDTSGSMWGRKLQQLQQAMYSILDNFREDDYFSLIQFSTNVVVSFSVLLHTGSIKKLIFFQTIATYA